MNNRPTPKNGRKCAECTFVTVGLDKTACHVCTQKFPFRTCENCTFDTVYGSDEDPTNCHACEAPFEEPPLVVRKSRHTRRPSTTGGCSAVKSTRTRTRVCKMCTFEAHEDKPNCPVCDTPYGDSPYGLASLSPRQSQNSSQKWVLECEFKWVCNGCANKNRADDDFCMTCGTEKE